MSALREAKRLLRDLGVPYTIEEGSRHHKLLIHGRFVSVIPHGRGRDVGRNWKNFEAEIRRRAREPQ
jgi:hypothetical protein